MFANINRKKKKEWYLSHIASTRWSIAQSFLIRKEMRTFSTVFDWNRQLFVCAGCVRERHIFDACWLKGFPSIDRFNWLSCFWLLFLVFFCRCFDLIHSEMHDYNRSNTINEIDTPYVGEEQILIPSSPIWPRSANEIKIVSGLSDSTPTTPGTYHATIRSGDSNYSKSR